MLTLNLLFVAQKRMQEQPWQADGYTQGFDWIANLGNGFSVVVLVSLAWLLLRAFKQQARYRATSALSPSDLEELKQEIAIAEKRTVGEILPVVVERSDAHPQALWLSGLCFVILGTACLASDLPLDRPLVVLIAQLSMGAIGYGAAFFLPAFARHFVREARATEMAEEQAFQEFYRHGLHATEAQTGVLIFVSLFERRVVVLADEGINAKVEKDQWRQTDEAILEPIAKGSLKAGLIAGIKSAAVVLEEYFPWTDGDRNEVPDRMIVRRE